MKQKQNSKVVKNSKSKHKRLKIILLIIAVILFLFFSITSIYLLLGLNNNNNFDDPIYIEKPVMYLYPEDIQETQVRLDYKGKLAVTYPEYKDGWEVVAYPDGTLINKQDSKEYSYLFWEGVDKEAKYDMTKGFVVEGVNTAEFLQDKLSELGLTPKEYNEFIVYWLPQMINNKYNLIHFATKEEYHDRAELVIDPKPDSMLRVFMVFKKLDKPVSVEPQLIQVFERKGFSVVEWGGSEVR